MKKFPFYVTLGSAVPFVALSVAVSFHTFHDSKPVIEILLTYAAVVLSFLGGIHWGLAVSQYMDKPHTAQMLMVESVLPCFLAWGILFYHDIHIQLLTLTLLYTFVWVIDSMLSSNSIIPQWFFVLRTIVTPIVVVSLYVAYFGLV